MRSWLVPLVLVLAASVPGRADDATPISEQDVVAPTGWGPLEGKLVEVRNVKFRDFFQPNVRVAKIPPEKFRIDADQYRTLADNLSRWKTATGDLDRKGRSNVRIIGIARDDAQSGRVIDVTEVVKLQDDVPAFTARAQALGADTEARLRLADEARRRAELYGEDDLRDWSRQAFDGALDTRRSQLAKDDVKGLIDVALKYRDLAGSTAKAITILGDFVKDPATPEADHAPVLKVLDQDLQAVLHKDRWMPREEYKIALGCVPRRDGSGNVVWIRKERAELEAQIAKQRDAYKADILLRKGLDSEYEAAANAGEAKAGMYKAEVVRMEIVRTKATGFPVFVDRKVDRAPAGDVSWDQWVMADKTRYYFMRPKANEEAVLYAIKKSDQPFDR